MGEADAGACTKHLILFSAIDIFYVLIVAIPLLVFNQLGQPFERGFFCDDESIKHPYKDSTIPSSVLYSVGFACNVVGILIIEGILFYHKTKINSSSSENQQSPRKQKLFHQYFCAVYTVLLPFVFGASVEHLTTDIAKYQVGRLRPHFLSICKPNYSIFSCNDSTGYRYIEENVCTGDADLIKEGRLSFPSGHASFSSYCMVFLTLYMQYRITWKKSVLLKPLLQVIVLYMSYFTCISRISDYKHHWSDVLAGAIIGIVSAILVVYGITDLPPSRKTDTTCCNGEKRNLSNELSRDSNESRGFRINDDMDSDEELPFLS